VIIPNGLQNRIAWDDRYGAYDHDVQARLMETVRRVSLYMDQHDRTRYAFDNGDAMIVITRVAGIQNITLAARTMVESGSRPITTLIISGGRVRFYVVSTALNVIRTVDVSDRFTHHRIQSVYEKDGTVYLVLLDVTGQSAPFPSGGWWPTDVHVVARYSLDGEYIGHFNLPKTPFYPYPDTQPGYHLCIRPGSIAVANNTILVTDTGYSGWYTRWGSGVYAFSFSGVLQAYIGGIGDWPEQPSNGKGGTYWPEHLLVDDNYFYIESLAFEPGKIKRYSQSFDPETLYQWSVPSIMSPSSLAMDDKHIYAFGYPSYTGAKYTKTGEFVLSGSTNSQWIYNMVAANGRIYGMSLRWIGPGSENRVVFSSWNTDWDDFKTVDTPWIWISSVEDIHQFPDIALVGV
jgi:hypothetical protein